MEDKEMFNEDEEMFNEDEEILSFPFPLVMAE